MSCHQRHGPDERCDCCWHVVKIDLGPAYCFLVLQPHFWQAVSQAVRIAESWARSGRGRDWMAHFEAVALFLEWWYRLVSP